ncbi:MAG TPA: type II toxin-antitoxin system HicB family antitoxin [Gammaproteobacteria bacterium]
MTAPAKAITDLAYPARLYRDEGAWSVEFRDVEGVFTWGETRDEAIFNAQDALDGMLSVMIQEGDEIAWPGKARKTDVLIPVSAHVAAPLLLYLTRRQQDLSMAEVARRLKVTYQAYQRMEKVGGNLTLKNLERAAAAMGAAVELRMIPLSQFGKPPRK